MADYRKRVLPTDKQEAVYEKQTQQIETLGLEPTARDSVYKGQVVYFNEWRDREGNLYFRQIVSMAPFYKTSEEKRDHENNKYKITWGHKCKR